jgi:hypothetical protein
MLKRNETPPSLGAPLGCHTLGEKLADSKRRSKERERERKRRENLDCENNGGVG